MEINSNSLLKTTEEKIKALIVEHFQMNIKPEDIDATQDFFLREQGFNSIDSLDLLLRIEREFSIEIPDENLNEESLRSIRSLSSLVVDLLAQSE